jgi:hypothetical protein
MRSLMICSLFLIKYYLGRQSEKNDIRGPRSTNGGKERFRQVFWWETLREKYQLEDPGVDGKVILRFIFREWNVGASTELIWLSLGAGGVHLQTQ